MLLYKGRFGCGGSVGHSLISRWKKALWLFTFLSRNQSSSPVVYGRNMPAKRRTALPRGRKKWPQGTSPSVLKKVGNVVLLAERSWLLKMRYSGGDDTVQIWGHSLINTKGSQLSSSTTDAPCLKASVRTICSLHRRQYVCSVETNKKEQELKKKQFLC